MSYCCKNLSDSEEELIELYRRLETNGGNWSQPFIAGRGEHFSESNPKVLFVGKATYGWDDVDDPYDRDSIRQASDNFLNGEGEYQSAFWDYIEYFGEEISLNCWQNPFKHVAWTNIARIGLANMNPEGDDFEVQRRICRSLLRSEICCLQPNLVVLLTSDYQWKFVVEFFTEINWQYLRCLESKALYGVWMDHIAVVWTSHPQGKRTEVLVSERNAIINFYRHFEAGMELRM